jgi:hypothetical protein
VPAAQAVALGILLYLLNLIVSLLGAPAFAVGGGRRMPPEPDPLDPPDPLADDGSVAAR